MDFSSVIATWQHVLTQPSEETFAQEAQGPNATLTTALIWMVIAGVIAGILGGLRAVVFAGAAGGLGDALRGMNLPPQVANQFGMLMGGGGFMAIIVVPLGFLIGAGIVHLLATVLGGSGDFGKLAYLIAAYQAPITIAAAIIGLIPFLGGCVATLLAIYGLVLEYFAVKANYGLTQGRALAVVLIPLAIAVVLAICVGVVIGAVVAGLSG
jgi:hypothetical protein